MTATTSPTLITPAGLLFDQYWDSSRVYRWEDLSPAQQAWLEEDEEDLFNE